MYNNFNQALAKENDVKRQAHLSNFYGKYYEGWNIHAVDFDSSMDGALLQRAGVDKILYCPRTHRQLWIQEKIVYSSYPNFMFEYEKRSGEKGWAVSEGEKSDYLLYDMNGTIYLFKFNELRSWLTANLERFIKLYRFDTDNKNVNVPIKIAMKELNELKFGTVVKISKDLERITIG